MSTMQPEICAGKLKALSDPHRLRIVDILRQGALCASKIAESIGVTEAIASHHLAILFNHGFLQKERQGRFIIYRLGDDVYDAKHHHEPGGCLSRRSRG